MSKPKITPLMSVSAVGNSWIVAKSRSHPGHIYYFNTLTGEAVWNLSEAEIQNARRRTQALASQTGAEPSPNVEPKDNPPTNKIIKTLSNGSHEMSQANNVQHHSEVNIINLREQSSSVYSDVALNSIETIGLNNLNNAINSVSLLSSPVVYNANGWPISHAPIFVTSTIPYLSQGQPMNVACKQLIMPNESTALRLNNLNTLNRRFQTYQPRKKYGAWGQRRFHKYQMSHNDLRKQLHLKRRLGSNTRTSYAKVSIVAEDETGETTSWSCGPNTTTADVSFHVADIIEEELKDHEEEQVEDESNTNTCIEEIQINLDLTPLKTLATSNMKSQISYIVTNLKVLFEEFNFLNAMINSDKDFHLMVPENVISELKDYISCSNNKPARRIYHSLMQQVEDGCAFIAEEPSQDYGDSIKNPILKTCLQLFERNHHVILITDDSELLSYKKFIKINIFSVVEIKTLLHYNHHSESVSHPMPISSQHNPLSVRKEPVVETIVKDSNVVKTTCKQNTQAEDDTKIKHTVDAAVQTETVTVINQIQNTNTAVNGDQIIVEISNNSCTEQTSDKLTKTLSNLTTKRRAIKLKRSISNQPLQSTPIPQSTQKKPFRWHRKRNHPDNEATEINTSDDKPTSDCKIASIQTDTVNIESDQQVSEMPKDNNNIEVESSSISDNVIESRESSIILTHNNTQENKIIIEETSTSGIISNTDSNVDIEMSYNNFEYKGHGRIGIDENDSKIIMHEVSSDNMDENLRTKCEEWVSRFIQIMEDVLAVVLRREPAFSNIEFRPPWTVHEAAQCIKKYSNDTTVKILSDKLSMVLFRLSDDKGNITRNMSPWQYMEMYSYGVSLLDAVKAIATSCMQDIQLAEECLKKLLMDIKSDHCLNDPQEDSQDIQEPNITGEHTDLKSPQKKVSKFDNKLPKKYDLRSKREKLLQDTEKSQIESIELMNGKTTFLSILSLQETSPKVNLNETIIPNGSKNEINERTQVGPHSSEDKNSNVDNETENIPSTQVTPTIVRNFSKCAEFEKRLKDKLHSAYDSFDEYLNYEEDYEYGSEDDESDELSDPNITQVLETSDIDISESLATSSPLLADPHVASDSNNTFKFMICLFLQEVKNAINEVKVLCDKCYTELKNPQLPTVERNELRKRAENAQIHIIGLSTSLNSMLDQNPESPDSSMMSALKKAGINMSQIDKRLLLEYWNTVAEWKKYADVFQCSIKDIITALKSLNG